MPQVVSHWISLRNSSSVKSPWLQRSKWVLGAFKHLHGHDYILPFFDKVLDQISLESDDVRFGHGFPHKITLFY